MKKIIALIMVLALCVCAFAACGDTNGTNDDLKDAVENEGGTNAATTEADDAGKEMTESDIDYVKGKGKLVVGITEFAPMDYKDADDGETWIGFDADCARAFAKELGVEVEFIEIEWGSKAMELEGKSIDCVWNGMTLNDEVLAAMDCSNAYCNNQQVVVVPADKAADYQTVEDCKELNFAVEAGSAGEEQALANGFKVTSVETQSQALFEIASGTADAAVIDSLMAAAMVGEGTGYEDLTYTVGLNDEKYGVGFRKGSDMVEKLNEFFKTKYADGTLEEIADTYGVTAALIPQ